jgi:hypothetical protein
VYGVLKLHKNMQFKSSKPAKVSEKGEKCNSRLPEFGPFFGPQFLSLHTKNG